MNADVAASICRSYTFYVSKSHSYANLSLPLLYANQSTSFTTKSLFNLSFCSPGSSLSFRRQVLEQHPFDEDPRIIAGEDREILFRIALAGLRIFPSSTFDFAYNNGSSSTNVIYALDHISSPSRSLIFCSYVLKKYYSLFPRYYFADYQLSYLIASFRSQSFTSFFTFLFSPNVCINYLFIFCCFFRRIFKYLFVYIFSHRANCVISLM